MAFQYKVGSKCSCHPVPQYSYYEMPISFFTDFEKFLAEIELKYQNRKVRQKRDSAIKQEQVKILEEKKLLAELSVKYSSSS